MTLVLALLAPSRAADLHLGPTSLSVIGQESLTFRAESVSGPAGSATAYRADYYASRPGVEHRTDLIVHGNLLPGLRIDAALARGPYVYGQRRLTLTWDGTDASVKVGDLTVAFDGALAPFRRSLRGLQVDARLARGTLNLLASECKPNVRTETIYGRNSPGPYYLSASPLVDASEVVEVDGRPLRRGYDYSIDYQIGLLQFAPTLIIAPTSQITVSYEHDAPGSLSGELVGLRASYPAASGLRVGATYLTLQRRPGVAASSAAREERFIGANSPGPFVLAYRPIVPASERVRLDGILQVQGRDYLIDYASGSIVFFEPVPLGASLLVSYQVVANEQPSPQERSLVAVDAHYAAGPHLSFDAEAAHSSGGVNAVARGAALALGVRGRWERFSLAANLRDMGSGFAPFESAGYKDYRSGYDCQVGFAPAGGVRVAAALRDYHRPYSWSAASDLLARDRTAEVSLDLARAGWPTLSYLGAWSALSLPADEPLRESAANHLLTAGYQTRAFGVKTTYRRNAYARTGQAPLAPGAYGPSPFGSDSQPGAAVSSSGSGSGAALSMWYRPGTMLSIACDLARSSTALEGFSPTAADSARVAVEYAPHAHTSLSLGYRAASTGQAVSADGRTIPGQASRSQMVSIRHNPSSRLSLHLAYDGQMSQGAYGTDSDSDAWTAGFWWQPRKETLSLLGQYTRQHLVYLGSNGRSSNDIIALGGSLGPIGPGLKLDLSYSRMTGASSGTFGGAAYDAAASPYDLGAATRGMTSSSLRARLTYALNHRQQAFAEYETGSNAGYPGGARRQATALGWEMDLGQGINFTMDWRRLNSDAADPRYSYRVQTLSGRLGVKF